MSQAASPAEPRRLRLAKETLRFFAGDPGPNVGTTTFSGECGQCSGTGNTCVNEGTCLGSCDQSCSQDETCPSQCECNSNCGQFPTSVDPC
jgi:hypothetical protein